MKNLKMYEEFNNSEDFNERINYIKEVISYIKDICIPLYDSNIEVKTNENIAIIGIIANIMYDNKYIGNYVDFFKHVEIDVKDLSDIFYIFIKIPFECFKLPDWILDVIYHVESYMMSEGFKTKMSVHGSRELSTKTSFENQPKIIKQTIDNNEDISKEQKFAISGVRLGFYI